MVLDPCLLAVLLRFQHCGPTSSFPQADASESPSADSTRYSFKKSFVPLSIEAINGKQAKA